MAITYTYKITRIDTYEAYNNFNDVVKGIEFEYIASKGTGEDKKTAKFTFYCELGDPDLATFKQYADLTEADVREFVKKTVNVENNKLILNNLLAEQDLPVKVVKNLPWA